jgi:hypothetical protein
MDGPEIYPYDPVYFGALPRMPWEFQKLGVPWEEGYRWSGNFVTGPNVDVGDPVMPPVHPTPLSLPPYPQRPYMAFAAPDQDVMREPVGPFFTPPMPAPPETALPQEPPAPLFGGGGASAARRTDPRWAMLAAAAAMLQQSGPSTTKRTFGQIAGSGLQAGMEAHAAAGGRELQRQQIAALESHRASQLWQQQQQHEAQTRLQRDQLASIERVRASQLSEAKIRTAMAERQYIMSAQLDQALARGDVAAAQQLASQLRPDIMLQSILRDGGGKAEDFPVEGKKNTWQYYNVIRDPKGNIVSKTPIGGEFEKKPGGVEVNVDMRQAIPPTVQDKLNSAIGMLQNLNDIRSVIGKSGWIEGLKSYTMAQLSMDDDAQKFLSATDTLAVLAQAIITGIPSDFDVQNFKKIIPSIFRPESVNRARILVLERSTKQLIRDTVSYYKGTKQEIPPEIIAQARALGVNFADIQPWNGKGSAWERSNAMVREHASRYEREARDAKQSQPWNLFQKPAAPEAP